MAPYHLHINNGGYVMTDIIQSEGENAKRIDVNIVPLCGCTINVPADCSQVCS